ncbi:HNH endonuclease signature motif containing protein [Nocardioides deserti]|uniref:DUF222 domain-containing protein n=1 Tax=Nocardioides deserti TaxID=1588644 RepID=A0ABR6U7P2_9ACTN|nr:HNH endonuclease signature motif containing protein [Nocardioides deserti]MBC2960432.1 DUF222 domain-containing protein [Nocardioides deserti]GGO71403.1 HNH endonuclease [Nocardioides deserti]
MAEDSRHNAHPVCRAVVKSRKKARSAAGSRLWTMSDDEVSATLVEATRLRAQVEALELRLAAEADRRAVGDRTGATDTASWWGHETRQDRPAAMRRMRLAESLDRHASTSAALAEGAISIDHARVITECVDRLPDGLPDPTIPERAEKHLLTEALGCDPKTLAILAKHVLTVVAPEIGEERDARALEQEEREARAKAWLTMAPDGRGSYRGKFSIPTLHGEMLKKMLLAFAAPKHQATKKDADQTGEREQVERRPSPERLGDAFCELLERLPADKLPMLGGLNASIIVLIDYTNLKSDVGRAVLDSGQPISASMARRMACEAGLLPAVLGARSELLDLGRTARLFSGAQRRGLAITQKTCTTAGCDWPAHLCHAHHDDTWLSGGRTDLEKGRLLCPRHHARIHDPRFETTIHPDNQVTFHMRT